MFENIKMSALNLTQEMKRQEMLMTLAANNGDSEIASFLNVIRSFMFKDRNEMEASSEYASSVARRNVSKYSDIVRKSEYVHQVQYHQNTSIGLIAIGFL